MSQEDFGLSSKDKEEEAISEAIKDFIREVIKNFPDLAKKVGPLANWAKGLPLQVIKDTTKALESFPEVDDCKWAVGAVVEAAAANPPTPQQCDKIREYGEGCALGVDCNVGSQMANVKNTLETFFKGLKNKCDDAWIKTGLW